MCLFDTPYSRQATLQPLEAPGVSFPRTSLRHATHPYLHTHVDGVGTAPEQASAFSRPLPPHPWSRWSQLACATTQQPPIPTPSHSCCKPRPSLASKPRVATPTWLRRAQHACAPMHNALQGAAAAARHNRAPGRHRLQRYDAKVLVLGRVQHGGTGGQQQGALPARQKEEQVSNEG